MSMYINKTSLNINQITQNSYQPSDFSPFLDTIKQFFSPFFSAESSSINAESSSISAAPKEEYGNKHAGLIKVAALLQKQPIEGVVIPMPKGLSHASVEAYLRHKDPEIFIQWEKLGTLFPPPKTGIAKIIDDLTNQKIQPSLQDPEVLAILADIQTRIENAFDNPTEKDLAFFANEELTSWLEELSKRNTYLMVRSSSVEDTKELANAGGNLSERYIAPTLKEMLSSSGRVVSSYFGISSLKNRLSANKNPFHTPLLLPVMLHELIGEEIGGSKDPNDIPISLVLFTTEPNDSEKGFSVTKISSTFGHGEGVVGAQNIGSDTIHVIESAAKPGTFFSTYQNRAKETRLAPCKDPVTGKVDLQAIENPKELQYKKALDDDMLTRLAVLAKELQTAFNGDPMDVEIVIRRGIIHIVQARPVVRPQANPSYLNLDAIESYKAKGINPVQESFQAKVLTPGTGSCLILNTKQEELLVCNSLKKAEELFDKTKHKCVIVSEDEPANSHPVVNFSSLGIPCLYLPEDSEKVNTGSCVVICPQSGRILKWDNDILKPTTCIEKGYVSHPASIAVSLFDKEKDELPPVHNTKPHKDVPPLLRTLQEERISSVAMGSLLQLKTTWKMEIDETKALCARVGKTPPAFFDKLSEKLENVFEELKLVYTNPTPRLRKLFLIKTLSSLLTGQIDGSLTTYSLLDVSNLKGQLSKEIAYRQKISSFKQTPHFSEFLPLGEYVGSKEMENTWENFLISLEKLPLSQTIIKDRSSLQELFSSLRQLSPSEHFIGAFLNFICLPQILQNNKADTTLHNLAALSIKDLPLFQDLVIKNKQIAEIKQRLYAFQDPQALPTIRKELLNLHSFFSNENSFLTPTRTGNSLIKLISAEILKELVETTDLAIKSLKVSAHLSNREKIIQMELILRSNFTMLFTWFRKLIPDAERGIFFQNDSFKSYNGYENFIQNAWSRLYNRNTPEQNLQPSPNFSVGAAVINAFTNYNRHTPQTLEDIFTLLHQNQIIAVSTFAFKEQKLTALPNSLQSAMKTVKDKIPKASLQGAEISPKGIRLQYNIPLQNHSAGFEIEYIKETDSFLIHGKLFGESRQRWPACSEYLQALHSAGGLSLAKAPQLTSQELLFTWKLTDDDDLSSAIDQFNQFLDYSFTPDKQSIFNKIKNYLSSKPSLLAGVGKWFYEHNINAPSLVNSYLATI